MTCTYCEEKAYVRCRKHRQYLCGCSECVDKHRGFHSVGALDAVIPSAWGDCQFVEADQPLRGWKQHVLATVVALAVGSLVMLLVAL